MSIDVDRLRSMMGDHRPFHSRFQIENYILARAGGTSYGMYKQALRELESRAQGLTQAYIEREELRTKLERSARWGWLRGKLAKLERARTALQLDSLERQIVATERELAVFYAHASTLKAHLGELEPERLEALEAEHCLHKLKVQCARDLLSHSEKLADGTLELLMALPTQERGELFDQLATHEGRIDLLLWAREYEPEFDIDRQVAAEPLEGGLGHALHALAAR